jgi:hypothetical protein
MARWIESALDPAICRQQGYAAVNAVRDEQAALLSEQTLSDKQEYNNNIAHILELSTI